MKSAAPDTPPSFRPEVKAVARTVASAPAYVAYWVRPQTAACFSMLLLLTAVAVAAEVVTVVAAVAETPYDAV